MRVGFLGLGRMGTPITRNLVADGHEVTVWNRTRKVAEQLAEELPVRVAGTPAELAAQVEVTMAMVADDSAVEQVYIGDGGILEGLAPGSVCIDHSTVAPATIKKVAAAVTERGSSFVESPVSGSTNAAEGRTLLLMVGGDDDAVARVRPVLGALGSSLHHLGPVGTGAAMKLAVNSVVYGLNSAVSEALVLAERAGIAREAAYEIFATSAVGAPVVHYRRTHYERPAEAPVSFRLTLGVKDLHLITELAREVGAPMPVAECNLTLHAEAADGGFADWDLAAVAEYLRRRADAG
jgi:3-hydroxyisobutyrate dehydrogenase-like beta-hydroxyacid dehydrogenase